MAAGRIGAASLGLWALPLLAHPAPAAPAEPMPAMRPPTQLFVSPAGEPFRAPFGEPYPVGRWFAGADTNGDGQLTRAEFIADGVRWFAAMDSNGNGLLDRAEIDHYEVETLPEMSRGLFPGGPAGRPRGINMPPPGGPPGGGPAGPGTGPPRSRAMPDMPRGAGLYSLINAPHPVKAADANLDSRVTPEEWRRILASRFLLLDKAGRGALLLDELPQTPVQAMAAPRERRRR
jgi:hypothetical protein